jgi:PAS domain S-box-containing protein
VTAAAVQCRELQTSLSAARRELDAAETALLETNARVTRELVAAGKQAAECEALQVQIRQEGDARAALEAEIAGVRAELSEARNEHQSAAADVARLIEREALLASELTAAHTALRDMQQRHDVALKAAAGELAERQAHFEQERAQAEAEHCGLTVQLREVKEARDQALRGHQSALADITRLTEREAELERRLNDERATRDTLEQAVAVTAAALHDEQQRHDVALKAAAAERTERERLECALTAASVVIEQLTTERDEIERRSEEARRASQDTLDRLTREHAAVMATREHDIEQLRMSLKARVEENHRLFQQAPMPMFRCTKGGVLTQANRMLTTLLGCSADELRGADLAASTFESPNDLSWLVERCLDSTRKESTETTWRRKDGSRLLVRLSACAISSDVIECGVEDLTPIRVLHDRLSQAHRMEAVGRLATEVAVTCGNLLTGVHENAQQWLTTDRSQPASRHHGEMLLEEIARAGGLLRQLAVYGDEESRRPAVVELRTVVRDVAPVLKRVAGDGVDVQLPAASAPLNVDAGAERVKRLLVNLAASGRERMPSGGRLKIELGTTVVDRHFAAKHPNVRLGPHALVTVTESRRPARTTGLLQLADTDGAAGSRSPAVQTRVDLGTVQELVSECGGHLWMTVEPVGDMVVKIRLPLATTYGEPSRHTSAPLSRARILGNWFQH